LDFLNGDYHLDTGSQCIDAGDPQTAPADVGDWDFDGDPRFNGTIDIGADERT
jgi:hypothetical protein